MYKPTLIGIEEMGFYKIERYFLYTVDDECYIRYTPEDYYEIVFDDGCGNFIEKQIYPKSKQDLLTLISILKE